jgi:hypothetical protein
LLFPLVIFGYNKFGLLSIFDFDANLINRIPIIKVESSTLNTDAKSLIELISNREIARDAAAEIGEKVREFCKKHFLELTKINFK